EIWKQTGPVWRHILPSAEKSQWSWKSSHLRWLTHLGKRILVSWGKGRRTAMFLPNGKKGRSWCHSRSLYGPLSSHPQQTPTEKSRTFWK
ncbi:unnamed protein product, partial [Bubo scandiacus]